MRIEREEPAPGAPVWFVTFADLMCLLMTFFVLLLSFSSVERAQFAAMAGSMRSAFGLSAQADEAGAGAAGAARGAESDELMVRLRTALEASGLEQQGTVDVRQDGVSLRLAGDAVFESGLVDLKPAAYPLLDKLVEIAATTAGSIEVEGHTDDVPISTARYPSNWELSTSRAGAAVRYLVSRGVPATRIRAIGLADTQPLVPNDSEVNRAKNRRVEFLFLPQDRGKHA